MGFVSLLFRVVAFPGAIIPLERRRAGSSQTPAAALGLLTVPRFPCPQPARPLPVSLPRGGVRNYLSKAL